MMNELYLQNIVQNISDDTLLNDWLKVDLATFSKNKRLFDFQQNALKNAIKALYLYYKDYKEKPPSKPDFFALYQINEIKEDLSYTKRGDNKALQYLEEYSNDYPEEKGKISFEHFINRMSFWMATGSGKTLVIVKLIEMLGKFIYDTLLPEKDILFLTYREDLLDQFRVHVEEFNSYHSDIKINLKSLKEYETIKYDNPLPFARNEITVFYYKSALITDEGKDKEVDFRTYDNNGNWYIILDEAHKGNKEDSKMQMFFNILSRNGFLFNFSATFTDVRDFATCVYNYNLAEYVKNGYGKHVYLSGENITAFKKKEDFTEKQKQRIILKILILHTIIKLHYEHIKEYDVYHNPLLLTLVDSVNTKDSDLELFFKELAHFAKNPTNTALFNEVKEELIKELDSQPKTFFDEKEIKYNNEIIDRVSVDDVLKYVFNAETNGNIEVLMLPGNKQELIFKLTTSDKPFALIKIGEIYEWIKNKLQEYTIIESFDNESYFKNINNDDSDINILMGSRTFYEGWDSNRPNIILFINIGIKSTAKKFVLQATGRGVRIQPVKDKRQRLDFLYNSGQIDKDLVNKIKGFYEPLETLFIFGTNASNLKDIISTLKAEKKDESLGDLFEINPVIKEKNIKLLIPVYKDSEKIIASLENPQKFEISVNDYELVKNYFNLIGEKIAAIKFYPSPLVLQKIKEDVNNKSKKYFNTNINESINNPELLLKNIFYHFDQTLKEFEDFKTLENEIIHFKNVSFSNGEKYEEIKRKIEAVKHYPEKQKELDKLYGKIPRKEYEKQVNLLDQPGYFEMKNQKIKIKYLANHYYIPVILSESEKIDYINHIIKVPSEVDFINGLEKQNNLFTQFDWWMFSKLDETLDEVYIPYYNPNIHGMAKFKPDFIFWLQKGNNYTILFIDPKGSEHTSAYRKIDGFSNIFEYKDTKEYKKIEYGDLTITVKLLLKSKDISLIPDNYKKYWFDDFSELSKLIEI